MSPQEHWLATTCVKQGPVRCTVLPRKQQTRGNDDSAQGPCPHQDSAHRLAPDAQTPGDGAHRDSCAEQTYCLGTVIDVEPKTATRCVPPSEVCEHRRTMNSVALGKLLDARSGQIVSYETVHLRGREKSLSRLDPPYDRTPNILRRRSAGTPHVPVNAPIPAGCQGFCPRGKVCERVT